MSQSHARLQALLQTAAAQRAAKWYEEAAAGKLLPRAGPEKLAAELARARTRRDRIRAALTGLAEAQPVLVPGLERAMLHCVSV